MLSGALVHHKAVLIEDNVVLVIGGRTSPLNPNNMLSLIKIIGCVAKWHNIVIHEESDFMEPRWRHSATVFTHNGI